MNMVDIVSIQGKATIFHLKGDSIAIETGIQFLIMKQLNSKSTKRIVKCQRDIRNGKIQTPTDLITQMNGMIVAKQIKRSWYFEDY
jgi:hypothetical protein